MWALTFQAGRERCLVQPELSEDAETLRQHLRRDAPNLRREAVLSELRLQVADSPGVYLTQYRPDPQHVKIQDSTFESVQAHA